MEDEATEQGPGFWDKPGPDPAIAQVYALWRSLGPGASLYDLWRLVQEPGSAYFLDQFMLAHERAEFLRRRAEWRKRQWQR